MTQGNPAIVLCVALCGSVVCFVWCFVWFVRGLCVNAKKNRLSLTHAKTFKKSAGVQRICCPYTQKNPHTVYILGVSCGFYGVAWGKLAVSYIRIPPQNFLLNICHAFCHTISTIGSLLCPSTI